MTHAGPSAHDHVAPPPWRNVRVLRVVVQVVVLLAVGLAAAYLFGNLVSAMTDRGLSFGFSFLERRAGFEIGESPVPYGADDTYWQAFLVGLLNTLFVSAIGIVLATVAGVLIGVARLSPNWLLRKVAGGYVEVIRNTPLLVQLFVIYFGVLLALPAVRESIAFPGSIFLNQRGLFVPAPQLSSTLGAWILLVAVGVAIAIGARVVARRREASGLPSYHLRLLGGLAFLVLAIGGWVFVGDPPVTFDVPVPGRFNFSGGLALSTSFTALLAGLVIYTAAFIAEVVRGGILAVRRGQVEAARALGLSEGDTLRLVVLPRHSG
jgi:general L-amino acid transport system permease protein